VSRAQDQHRRVVVARAQAAQHLVAGQAGQLQVEDHQVVALAQQPGVGVGAVVGAFDHVAVFCRVRQPFGQGRLSSTSRMRIVGLAGAGETSGAILTPSGPARRPASGTIGAMQLQDILFSQGFGTRRVCAGLVQQGLVEVFEAGAPRHPVTVTESARDFEPQGLRFVVQGVPWAYHEKAYLMLHKPAGTECSQKPSAWPSIYTLLPAPLRQRPSKSAVQGVQAVGRLDQDTTGLLLLSDDGQFIHRMSSPKKHVPKVYEVSTKHPISRQVQRLLAGVVLDDDPKPVRAAACEAVAPLHLRLTLLEGKYHQVKRMVAAVGNRVEGLHRSRSAA
jgi:16S rRNA pseudouridine516 synthase